MRVFREQRLAPRLPAPLSGRALGILGYHPIDLSIAGARIEPYDPVRPGSSWTVELPATLGKQTLSSRVVWTKGIESKGASGEGLPPHYKSGLALVHLTGEQQAALASIIERVAIQAKVLNKAPRQRKRRCHDR